VVGKYRYVLPSIWDNTLGLCTLGGVSTWNLTSNVLTQVSLSGHRVCGTRNDKTIWCSTFGQSTWSQRAGQLVQISIDGARACGITATNNVVCTTDIDNPNPVWTSLTGNFIQIDIHGDNMCAVNSANEPHCAPFMTSTWRKLGTRLLKQVSIYQKRICGVNSIQEVYCAPDLTSSTVTWTKLPGLMNSVDVYGSTICGSDSTNNVSCMTIGSAAWTSKNVQFRQVSIDTGLRTYGIKPTGEVYFNSAF